MRPGAPVLVADRLEVVLPSGAGVGPWSGTIHDGEQVLLTTDLHPGNLLAGEVPSSSPGSSRRWVLIDPKPYVGDPHYDLLQHMLNDLDRLRAEPVRFADRMADLAGLDRRRTRRWLFARCVQEAGQFAGLAEVALSLAADGDC